MSFNFYIGTQETIVPVPLDTPGTGALGNGLVRLLVNTPTEITNRGTRTVAVWNAGMFPLPCIKTQIASTAAQYRARMVEFLDIVAPVGGPLKAQIIECGNEPGQGSYPPGTDLAHYLDCLVAVAPLIRARGLKVMSAAMTNGATYTTGGVKYLSVTALSKALANGYRGATYATIDHAALHVYNGNEGDVVRAVENQRSLFPVSKGLWLTESGWPTNDNGPWPGEGGTAFPNPISESDRINKILNMGTALRNRADDLNLQGWSYFAYSNWGADNDRFEKCGLVTYAGVKKSGGNVTRAPSTYAPGGTAPNGSGQFTQSWQALNALPGVTPVGAAPPPPPPDPPPADPEALSVAAPITPASTRLLEAVRTSHTVAIKVEVLRAGEVINELEPIGGSVTYDSRAAIRATCDLTVADDGTLGWVPEATVAPLAPYGNELKVYRGVHFDDGTEEMVSLGIFRINEIEAVDSPGGLELRVSGADRAISVSDHKLEAPLNIPKGTLFTTAIRDLVKTALGYEPATQFLETEVTTPGLTAEEGDDPWEFAQGLATALAGELYWNSDGVLVLAPIPEVTEDSEFVAELIEGEGGVLLEASKRWSRTDAFNVVIVTAENSDINPPIREQASDNNPLSPTYAGVGSAFGRVPRFYANQYVTTSESAKDTARGILAAELGVTQQIDFGAVVNPSLRASDVVLIRRARIGVSEGHIIDSLTIPLDAETSMTGTTRLVFPQVIEAKASHLLLSPDTLLFSEQVLF